MSPLQNDYATIFTITTQTEHSARRIVVNLDITNDTFMTVIYIVWTEYIVKIVFYTTFRELNLLLSSDDVMLKRQFIIITITWSSGHRKGLVV